MHTQTNRRDFLATTAGLAAGSLVLGSAAAGCAAELKRLDPPKLTLITGSPRERGKQYGSTFKSEIQAFLDRELYRSFVVPSTSDKLPRYEKDKLLGYAADCGTAIGKYSPTIHDELVGMAEGAGIRMDEAVLITLHEELGHRGVLPKIEHCTAVAVGPPDTRDGHTFVGQTWDWMKSVAGLSNVLHWKRTEGPSVLAYAYPGLWLGAGMNSAGLAGCWTSAAFRQEASGPHVGIPSYVLLTHLLYQESIDAVASEARRATPCGWFTFVLGDSRGRLLNVEGSPQQVAVEEHRGRLARVMYGSRQMTGTPPGEPVKLYKRCETMYKLLGQGKVDRQILASYFSTPDLGICVGNSTLDMMIFDATERAAYVSRGPSYGADWKRFTFDDAV